MIAGWDDGDLLEEALLGARRSYVTVPDLRVIERPGWLQIVTPSFRNGSFNEVSLSVLDDTEADPIIDRTIDEYRRLGIRFRWSVTPESKPDDLADRLARRGLEASHVRAMVRATASLPPYPEHVHVEEVDAQTVGVYTRVTAEGWGGDHAALAAVHDVVLRNADRRYRLYLASYRGEPAGAAGYVAFARSAYLLGAVVLPRFRRLGVYRGLVAARLRDAAECGVTLATSQAMEATSAPLLERMGFQTVCRYVVFRG